MTSKYYISAANEKPIGAEHKNIEITMIKKDKILHVDEIKVGDILLCHKANDYIAGKIEEKTNSRYCHAAIYYGDSLVAESLALDGLKKGSIGKTNIDNFVARYDHVAVLRIPYAWTSYERIKKFKLFVDEVISRGAKYNIIGILRFVKNKGVHERDIYIKLNNFFDGELPKYSPVKSNYFCSEFVCDCLIATGIIEESAAVLYKSDAYSPGDLGADPTFGIFLGYLRSDDGYSVPVDDVFYAQSTFDEIYSRK